MVTANFIQTCKMTYPNKEFLIDLDVSIKETQFTIGTLIQIKKIVTENPNLIFDAFFSSLSRVTIEPTFPFPEFIHWVVKNYVLSTQEIFSADGTRVLCTINSKLLRRSFCLPIPNPGQNPIQFSEENSLVVIKALDPKQTSTFMSNMFKPDVSPSNFTFPYDITLFTEPIQVIFSLLSQILGLDSDRYVTEVMLGTVCLVSQSRKEFALNFDEFLVEKISSQLKNFHTNGKVFNYQTLLLLMVITKNLPSLQHMEHVYFSDGVDLSERNATIYFFHFTNWLMPVVYKIIFGSTMQRINEDLKLLLQNPVELLGDWFYYKEFTVMTVYGFEGEPYKLPRFLTRRIFVLEYLRQRLSMENEILIEHKKDSSIKFKFTLEPFVVESVAALTINDRIMKSMCLENKQKPQI